MEISWTAPPTPPRFGYLIAITGVANFSTLIRAATSPHILQLEPGTYGIQLRALSEHYPSDVIDPAHITIRGEYSLQATIRGESSWCYIW